MSAFGPGFLTSETTWHRVEDDWGGFSRGYESAVAGLPRYADATAPADFYDGIMLKKKYLATGALALPFALLLTGCSASDLFGDKLDESTTRTAENSKDAVADGLLPKWVPEGGTDIQLVQRNTGSERIFAMDYDGELDSAQCQPLKTVGEPSDAELAQAYASDSRTKNLEPEKMSKTRTLEADWWPEAAQDSTTDLCGRFWVHQADGKLYGFAPDTESQVQAILVERKAGEDSQQ